MQFQKARMTIEFAVPVGERYYGERQGEFKWSTYAEHDMLEHLKHLDDIHGLYVDTADRWADEVSDVSFDWGDTFERDVDPDADPEFWLES